METRTVIRLPLRQKLSAGERVALCLMFLASIVGAVAALPGASPAKRTPVAIVFPPWITGDEAVTRSIDAGHLVLRSGRSAFIVIVAADADTASAHRPQGAILVLVLAGLAGCLDARATELAA